MPSDVRTFRVLLTARKRMLANAFRSASRTHKIIIGVLVLFGAGIFTGIGIACAALILIMQGGLPQGSPLTPAATALVAHVYQYLFFFLLAGSVPYVASSLFQDNDLPLLLTTPATPVSVVAAKMLDAIAANSSQFIVLGVPVLIGLGWGMELSAAGWFWCLLSLTLVLILTPALTACLLLILARVFGMRRVRFVVMLVSALLALGITLLAVAGASRATSGGSLGFRQMGTVLMHGSGRSSEIKAALTHSLRAEPAANHLTLLTAGSGWLPSTWSADIALDTAGKQSIGRTGLEAAALLLVTAVALMAACIALGGRIVSSETILEQQDMESFGRKRSGRPHALTRLRGAWLGAAGLLIKDLRYVGRDTILLGQIGTTLILFLVPFVLRTTQPDDSGSSFDMYGDLAMLMICLIVFMVTSIIGLSSVGLEGRGVWIVLSSPMARRTFFHSKWTLSFLLSLGIVTVLTAIAALEFGWPWSTTRLLLGILACACYALSGLGVGLGGLFPRFLYDNPAHRASVWAMILGFVLSTAYVVVALIVVFAIWVAFDRQFAQAKFVADAGAAIFALLTLVTGILPIRLAERRLEHYEWEL